MGPFQAVILLSASVHIHNVMKCTRPYCMMIFFFEKKMAIKPQICITAQEMVFK